MKKDKILYEIHQIGKGNYSYPPSVATIASRANASKQYTHQWLKYFCDNGSISRIRCTYKNTVTDCFVSNDNVFVDASWIEEYLDRDVLDIQVRGNWMSEVPF